MILRSNYAKIDKINNLSYIKKSFLRHTLTQNKGGQKMAGEQTPKEKMIEALREAAAAWEEAGLPIVNNTAQETGKIALAILAKELFKQK